MRSKSFSASHILFAGFAVSVLALRLGPALLAGLFSYSLLELTHNGLRPVVRARWTRALSVAIFIVVAVAALSTLTHFLHQSFSAIPAILTKVLPEIDAFGDRYGVDLPFESLESFRGAILQSLAENAVDIPHFSGLLTRQVFYVVLSVFCALLAFVAEPEGGSPGTLYGQLRADFDARCRDFLDSFERVLGAQIAVSAINTAVTAVFLLVAGIPHARFLITATFFLGVLPIIGNILSNTLICLAAMTLSMRLASSALIFLVLIHKAQYLLSGRIIGSSIRIPMWQTLVGILLGEALLGLSGVLLAPAVLHYVRRELEALPATRS